MPNDFSGWDRLVVKKGEAAPPGWSNLMSDQETRPPSPRAPSPPSWLEASRSKNDSRDGKNAFAKAKN